ncbi:hypothetical protein TNCV_878841 [Trichonephila clavipes]|nr:hypothetical protein TNCV_878841 [Trichonephila clavipes]
MRVHGHKPSGPGHEFKVNVIEPWIRVLEPLKTRHVQQWFLSPRAGDRYRSVVQMVPDRGSNGTIPWIKRYRSRDQMVPVRGSNGTVPWIKRYRSMVQMEIPLYLFFGVTLFDSEGTYLNALKLQLLNQNNLKYKQSTFPPQRAVVNVDRPRR